MHAIASTYITGVIFPTEDRAGRVGGKSVISIFLRHKPMYLVFKAKKSLKPDGLDMGAWYMGHHCKPLWDLSKPDGLKMGTWYTTVNPLGTGEGRATTTALSRV